jgi:hypothetical protein
MTKALFDAAFCAKGYGPELRFLAQRAHCVIVAVFLLVTTSKSPRSVCLVKPYGFQTAAAFNFECVL